MVIGTRSHDEALRSLRRRATATRIVLGLHMGIDLVLLAVGSAAIYGWLRPGAVPLRIVAPLMGLASLAMMLSMLALTIALMLWLYRARANLVAFGLTELAYSPAWSVGSFFLPVVNLAVPPRSMRELHNRSNGEDVYQSMADVGDVSSWWTAFVAGATIQLALFMMSLTAALTNAYFTAPPAATTGMNLLGIFLLGLSAFFLFRVIGDITRAQQTTTGVSEAFA